MAVTLTVLGSSDAFNSAGRGNACYHVRDPKGVYCVDFGPTALSSLKSRGLAPEEVDAVFLTHLHADHFSGLAQLFIDAQYRARRTRPLTIAGPVGTERAVEQLYRLAYGKAARKRPFSIRYLEWKPGAKVRLDGRRIETFAARHMDPKDGALSLRVTSGKSCVAFSGDTGWTDRLPVLASGSDVLVCECTELSGDPTTHLSWELLRPRLPQLASRRIILSHLGEAVRKQLRRSRVRGLTVADDGMVVRL